MYSYQPQQYQWPLIPQQDISLPDIAQYRSQNQQRQQNTMQDLNMLSKFRNMRSGAGANMQVSPEAWNVSNGESTAMGYSPASAGADAGAGGAPMGGAGAGGLGAMGYGAIIAAAIAAQHGLSNNTDKTFEGVRTDDAFSGRFGTEPWLAYLTPGHATSGERFDAAVTNKDWGTAAKRLPALADYWGDPARGAAYEMGEEYGGSTWKNIAPFIDPIGWGLRQIG